MELSEKIAQRLSILVVDDEPNIRKVLSMALEAEGHQVVAVGNTRMPERIQSAFFRSGVLLICGLGRDPGWN